MRCGWRLRSSAPRAVWGGSGMVLVLIDADEDAPCLLGPELLAYAKEVNVNADVACVLANVEYETWFVAAAESLSKYLDIPINQAGFQSPEEQRLGKGWVQQHFSGPKYSPTQDQPAMTAKMDLALCRSRSPSFDKLCRELQRLRECQAS